MAARELSPSDADRSVIKAERTPGPWSYCGSERGGCSCMTVMGRDHPIATITSGEWGDEYPSLRLSGGSLDRTAEAYMERTVYGEVARDVAVANARLIAAAPDLLEALKAATGAINAAVQMGVAETQGHERIASRLDAQIEAARAKARAAILKASGAT